MRHNYKGRKLGTDFAHTKAMKRSLTQALFLNDRIKTVESRAKEIRRDADKVITWAKKGDIHSRRLAIAKLNDKEVVREVFEKAAQGMWADRNGGYTRIMKLGPRKGDAAEMVLMELVTEPVTPRPRRPPSPRSRPLPSPRRPLRLPPPRRTPLSKRRSSKCPKGPGFAPGPFLYEIGGYAHGCL